MTKLALFFHFLLPVSVISHLQSNRFSLLRAKQEWGNLPALSTWNPATSLCTWAGIQCSSTKAVTGISLYSIGITSRIPPSLCHIKTLETLNLSYNYIPGGFPTALYGCSALTHLDLQGNLFTGPIPGDIHKLSPRLHYLDLSANNFSGSIPASIGKLKELKTLNLMNNLFNGVYPPEISNLSKLESLVMATNPFTKMALPPSWGKLKNLKYLYMKECNLVGGIPPSFSGLESLEHLDLVGNGLVGRIPDGLFSLKALRVLELYNNELSGEIPTSVHALSSFTDIDLSNNKLSGSIPNGFGNLRKLRILHLFTNNLTGEIPTAIGLLPELESLKVYNNSLSGPLPPELGSHSTFQALEISENRFSGPLPENLCSRRALTGIVAFSNNLSGEIPKSLGNCTSLRTLTIYNNRFTGKIPARVWTLTCLYWMMLSSNSFTGRLPNRIARNMTILEVNNNKLSGPIPPEMATWTNIKKFSADNNMLSGNLPSGLTSLSNLSVLSLAGNRLSGELPLDMDSWESLTQLNLTRNDFSGHIPSAIGSLPSLSVLDLSSNGLSGEIPDTFGQLTLTVLNLSNNKLSGKIPYALDNEAFALSFFNNTDLCTSEESRIQTLPRCSTTFNSKHLSSKKSTMILVVGTVLLAATICFTTLALKKSKRREHIGEMTSWKFTPFHIIEFTESEIIPRLNEHRVIGSGGSGKVYLVRFENRGYSVAVKRIWNDHKIKNDQFLAEERILGKIRHANIVKLLCCISNEKSKLLVYEYMQNQSLDRWLHRRKRLESERRGDHVHVIDWPTRLRIAIGAAQGLCYMHHDCGTPIIHRDIKSGNILLDSEFNAKVADFGLARMELLEQGKLHNLSRVAGSFGYLAPEYRYTTKVNEKVDVYSFGVVLLELVTGKEPNHEEESMNFAEWSLKHNNERKPIIDVLDGEVMSQEHLEEMSIVFKLGLMCTSQLHNSRPSMKEVVQVLRQIDSPPENNSMRLKIHGMDHVIAFL